MNLYITPNDMSKEEFLVRYGMTGDPRMAQSYLSDPCDCHLLVCWISCKPDNLIQYVPSIEDFQILINEHQDDFTSWFIVEKELIAPYIPTGPLQ